MLKEMQKCHGNWYGIRYATIDLSEEMLCQIANNNPAINDLMNAMIVYGNNKEE